MQNKKCESDKPAEKLTGEEKRLIDETVLRHRATLEKLAKR